VGCKVSLGWYRGTNISEQSVINKKELLVTAGQGTSPKRRSSNTGSRACTFVTHVPISSGSRSLTATSLPGFSLGQGRPPVLHFYARRIFFVVIKGPFHTALNNKHYCCLTTLYKFRRRLILGVQH